MAYANHELHSDIHFKPGKARKKILKVLRESGMHRGNAAKALGCTHSTFLRWVGLLDLSREIERMVEQAKKEGWYVEGRTGRPAGAASRVKST